MRRYDGIAPIGYALRKRQQLACISAIF